MATSILPNIVDWARQAGPDGQPAIIAEMLSQCNEILADMIYQEANMPLAHKVTLRAGLPQGTWRALNQGVAASVSKFAQYQYGMGELYAYGQVDKTLADLGGNTERYRLNQDQGTIEGLGQQVASALFYANEQANPTQFTGLSSVYSTVSTSNAQSAKNVLDMGGTGSSNSSLWIVGFGDRYTYGIFPKGSPAGLSYQDKGDIRAIYDANGNPFEGYTSVFTWKVGLAVEDWRFNVRLANIDTTSVGLAGANAPDLFAALAKAVKRIPTASKRVSGITTSDAPGDPVPGVNHFIYVNRTVGEYLDIQAMRQKNVLLTKNDYDGLVVPGFRGIPIKTCDALTTSEARVV